MSAIMCIKPRFGLLSPVKCTQAMTICVWLVAKSFYWPFTRTVTIVSFILLSKAFSRSRLIHTNKPITHSCQSHDLTFDILLAPRVGYRRYISFAAVWRSTRCPQPHEKKMIYCRIALIFVATAAVLCGKIY